MKKVIEVLYNCNRCERKGCRGDVIRNRFGGIKQHLSCPGHQTPRSMKTTLLERASENEGSFVALGSVLAELGLQFDPIPRYPYFRFIVARDDEELRSDVF